MNDILTMLENLKNAYAMVSIEGEGAHIGRLKGLSQDADGTPVFDIDIDLLSCTTEQHPNIVTPDFILSETNLEYRGLCKNLESGDYDALFATPVSELLCKNRTKAKARLYPEKYDVDDIILQTRTVKTYKSEWQ